MNVIKIFIISTVLFLLTVSLVLPPHYKKEESYKVIKVDGKITITKTGQQLVTGVLFSSNDKLSFESQESRAAVISTIGGRFVLTPKARSGKASNLLPAMSNIATRSGGINNMLDIVNFFGKDFLLLDSMKIEINSSDFKMDSTRFFYMQYVYDADTINKKMDFNKSTLFLNVSHIYTIDNVLKVAPPAGMVKLFYKNETIKKTIHLTDFNLVTPDKTALINELKVMEGLMKMNTPNERHDEYEAFLYEFYGKTQRNNLQQWFSNNSL